MFISAGNTIQNKFSPDFCFKDLGQGQLLTWDKIAKAFVNTNLVDMAFDVPEGISEIKLYEAVGIGTQSLYIVPWSAISSGSLIITLDGVKQQSAAYTIDAFETFTNVQFSDVIPTGTVIEIVGLMVEEESAIKYFEALGDGLNSTYNLPWIAPSKESLFINIEGIKQQQDAYDIIILGDMTQLVLNGVMNTTDKMEVVGVTGDFGNSRFGITDARGHNLGFVGEGIFESRSITDREATLNFKSLRSGWGIELSSDGVSITITKAKDIVTGIADTVYMFDLTDEVKVFEAIDPITCTVPLNTTVPFAIGHEIEIIQMNGPITFTSEVGVTITSLDGALASRGIGSTIKLRKIYNDGWILSGDII